MTISNLYKNKNSIFDIFKIFTVSFTHFLLSLPFSFFSFSQIGDEDIKAFWQPPGYIFQIIWPLLYIIFGIISLKIIFSKKIAIAEKNKNIKNSILEAIGQALWIIAFSRFSNSPETYFRFRMQYYLSFAIIFSLMIFAWTIRLRNLYRLKENIYLLYIPYLLWISFATILNLQILLRIIYNY